MEPHIKDLVREIDLVLDRMVVELNNSVSDKKRGQKTAAKRARKTSLELEKLLKAYRKRSVQEIG